MSEAHAILHDLVRGHLMDAARAEWVFDTMFSGGLDEAQIGAMLALIAQRQPTIDELVGGARAMRRHATPVGRPETGDAKVIDTCGTGGAPKLYNVSTAVAFLVAAAAGGRVLVAKHGSTSRTGFGSAETLARLGVGVHNPPDVQAQCLAEIGVCFSFAVRHHPAMKHAVGPRRSLGFPTIFNVLGPLANPAGADRQLVGCYKLELAERMAHALARLGAERAWVVCSDEGHDELSTTCVNTVFEVSGAWTRPTRVDPLDVGLARSTHDELRVADADEATRAVADVIDGTPGPRFDVALLNAGAALVVGGAAEDLAEGVALSRQAATSGAARAALDALVERTRGFAEPPA